MANFDTYAPMLRRLEGGFVNNSSDPGGATMAGVTLATYRSKYGKDKTVDDLKHITDAEWRSIMKGGYWDKCKADNITSQSVAEMLADWCVNSGVTAIKKVQKMLGTKADGIVGPATLGLINSKNPKELFESIKKLRIQFYNDLVKVKPRLGAFLRGWTARVNSFSFKN